MTDTVSYKIAQKMEDFDSRLQSLEESQERLSKSQDKGFEKVDVGFDKVFAAIKGLKEHKGETESELLGSEKYNRKGIVHKVKENSEDIHELKDFKKKVVQLVSLIGAGISFLANAVIYILSRVV